MKRYSEVQNIDIWSDPVDKDWYTLNITGILMNERNVTRRIVYLRGLRRVGKYIERLALRSDCSL